MNRIILPIAGSVALLVAGCASTSPVTPASVAQDVVLLDQSLSGALAQVQGVAIPPAVPAALADLQTVATAIGAADTVAAAQPLVTRVEYDVNAVASAVATIPGPLQVWAADATILLPVIEAGVNLVVPASASASSKTPDDARTALRAMVK